MGTWGTGLYAGDFAADLRGAISAVARLPFEPDRLVDILCDYEPGAARESADPDHPTFWLVLADQFAKRGIVSPRVRDTTLSLIDSGADLAMMASRGMAPAGLRVRGRVLAELRERLIAPTSAKPRTVLKAPQPFLLEVGDVIVFPTSRGDVINPYFKSREAIPNWRHDGWGAFVVAERGRAFDFFAWYRPLVSWATTAKPDFAALITRQNWVLKRAGTLRRLHIQRMAFEAVGNLAIDAAKFHTLFPGRPSGVSDAVGDLSIANRLFLEVEDAPKPNYQPNRVIPTVHALGDIMAISRPMDPRDLRPGMTVDGGIGEGLFLARDGGGVR